MNLGIFNRVNSKESESGGMYSEWSSLSRIVRSECCENDSVLSRFPAEVGRDVALSIVRQLASNIGITQSPGPSPLTSDNQVQWAMEVICYGLSLPLGEHDALRDCVNIYCDWLSVLHPNPNPSVPPPLTLDPNTYARKIIRHLHNLFIPRKGEAPDTIKRQAVLCHRVLRTLQQVSQHPENLSRETWEAVLIFLLAINETLLAAPTIKDDVGDQLCERVLSVLFEVWLEACGSAWFPPPPLWRTLREMAQTWRHRLPLVHHWNRVNLALSHRLIAFLLGPQFPIHHYTDDYEQPMPTDLTREAVAQAWFRFIHTLGSPLDLVRPGVISQTPKFLHHAMMSESASDPATHPCLTVLPTNFLRAIKGISMMVDAFLGIMSEPLVLTEHELKKETPTPPPHRRPAKSFSVSSSSQKSGSKAALISLGTRAMSTTSSSISSLPMSSVSGCWEVSGPQNLAADRPKCNSLLHLFGEWLFEAAQVGTGLYSPIILKREGSGRRTSSLSSVNTDPGEEPNNRYQAGRAMALATLCRIFCSKKTGEHILPVYYARFYLVLIQGLRLNERREVDEPLVSILLNCSDLLRLDLDGVQILIPYILESLEAVLSDKDLPVKSTASQADLRKACINLLLSMLVLPLHFSDLAIKELVPSWSTEKNQTCFGQLKPRIMNLLTNALQVETDPQNTHMLLGGLLVLVQEAAIVEGIHFDSSSMNQGMITSHTSSSLTPDSVQVLFVRATYLVCHRLISFWKSDLSVSLAALELLTGLANTGIIDIERVEWERGMKWVCDYIVHQCWRPPQFHSKDLHSSIVAAYSTVSAWVLAQPALLTSPHTLNNVLEVIELGISGSKSQGKKGEGVKMKDEKEMKPVSMRVRDAAEALLSIVLEHAGYFPGPCGAESVSGLVDENVLLRMGNSQPLTTRCRAQTHSTGDPRSQAIKYFSLSNSVLLAMYEDPLGNYQEPQPIVTVIIRGGFGRHTWSFQLRQLPRHRSTTGRGGRLAGVGGPGRPVYTNPGPSPVQTKTASFPDAIYRIPQCAIDRSLGDLDCMSGWDRTSMSSMLRGQADAERAQRTAEDTPECTPPRLAAEFNTTRMFLSHFGLLNKMEDGSCPVVALDSTKEGLFKELEALDKMEPRTCDTCHVFYVRAGQSHYKDILANVEQRSSVSLHFLQVLRALGWPKVVSNPVPVEIGDKRGSHGGSAYSGHKRVLYWADATSQLTFLVPTNQRLHSEVKQTSGSEEKSRKHQTTYPIFVVWLESLEDSSHFPLEDLIEHTNSGVEGWFLHNCTVIYLHALESGLFRIKVKQSTNRPCGALPLVNGIVVSRNLVGSFVRQTALNICRRKRLDNESYQPPHTRRRHKIQEITSKFEINQPRPDFLNSLFN